MAQNKLSERDYLILSSNSNFKDIEDFFEGLIAELSDIRSSIKGLDNVESRKAMVDYLQDHLDTLKRVRNNVIIRKQSSNDLNDT